MRGGDPQFRHRRGARLRGVRQCVGELHRELRCHAHFTHACARSISLRCTGKTSCIFEQQNQLPFVCGCRLEAKTTIERIGIFVEGVCQQSPNACVLCNCNRSANSILQQAETKTLSLVIEIDSEPRQNDQRNRLLAHPATNPLGSVERVDLPNGQTEVPGNATSLAGDERFR